MQTYAQTLDAHLRSRKDREEDFAKVIGKTQAAVNRYRNGARFPDAETARTIDAKTKGAVPFSVWQAEFLARSGLAA